MSSNNPHPQDSLLQRLVKFLNAPPLAFEPEKMRKLLSHLITIRVFIVSLVFAVASWKTFQLGQDSREALFWFLGGLYAVSAVNAVALRTPSKLNLLGILQLLTDLVIVSLTTYFNPSSSANFLFLLVIIEAAVVFGPFGAVTLASLSGVSFALLQSGLFPHQDPSRAIPPQDLLVVYISFIAVALVSSYFATLLKLHSHVASQKSKDLDDLASQQKQLIDDISDGVVMTDLDSVITGVNQTAKAILGLVNLDPQRLIGMSLPELVSDLGLPRTLSNPEETPSSREITLPRNEARPELHLRYQVRPMKNSSGELIGRMLMLHDVSRVRTMEEQLQLHEKMTKLLSSEVELPNLSSAVLQDFRMVADSPIMRKVYQLVERVAPSDASVLITGESGTGKELIAKSIHALSPRSAKPFIAINCGAIPEHLIESELFGHRRGSFTGAVSDHIGLFRQANGGTIFLDEVGELPLHLQTKLLRVLQEKRVRAVGDVHDISIDVRVVAATNRDLRKEIHNAKFREDLFYRLNVVNIVVPSLRDRREDIPVLIRHFIGRNCGEDRVLPQVSPEALQLLMSYPFPGNVRELENAIERALVLGGQAILPEHFPEEMRNYQYRPATGASNSAPQTEILVLPIDLEGELSRLERDLLTRALEKTGGAKKQAAELLGLNFRSFRYRLKKYGLSDSVEADD